MEEILRQAFQLGQQWTHDINNENEPMNFNTWFNSDLVQNQVKKLNILDVRPSLPIIEKIEKDIESCYEEKTTGCSSWCGSDECSPFCGHASTYKQLSRDKLQKTIERWQGNEA